MNPSPDKPVVLCLSGLDPCGGAGIQADIETLQSLGCHCAPVITSLTVQDTVNISRIEAVPADLFIEQAQAVIADLNVACIKIGLIGSLESLEAIRQLLLEHPHLPVVLDPILRAGGGFDLGSTDIAAALSARLLPLCSLITPNTSEAQLLAGSGRNPQQWASALLTTGCRYAAITGTHASDEADQHRVTNRLYGMGADERGKLLSELSCERLPDDYHGSGCTFASAVAATLASNSGELSPRRVVAAFERAQAFTFASLLNAQALGGGQRLPDRRLEGGSLVESYTHDE